MPPAPHTLLPPVSEAVLEAGHLVAAEFARPDGPRFSDHVTASAAANRGFGGILTTDKLKDLQNVAGVQPACATTRGPVKTDTDSTVPFCPGGPPARPPRAPTPGGTVSPPPERSAANGTAPWLPAAHRPSGPRSDQLARAVPHPPQPRWPAPPTTPHVGP